MRVTALLAMLGVAGAVVNPKIGMIMPQTNNGAALPGITWKQVTCAALLAVQHVNNNDNTIVPTLSTITSNLGTLTGNLYDTGYSASPAIVSYRQMRADGGQALVGAARSAVSTPLAQLAEIDQVPQVATTHWNAKRSCMLRC